MIPFYSPYHTETDVNLERFHGVFKSMLRSIMSNHGKDWDEFVPWVFVLISWSTGKRYRISSLDLLFGHLVMGPLSLVKQFWLTE